MYNKNQFKKVNDKKVLHKIKKHWVTVSVALLGLIGGGAIATTNASANTTNSNDQNNDNQANHSLNVNQMHNQQLKLVNNNQANYSNQLNSHQYTSSESSMKSNQAQNITSLANQLHNSILINRINNDSSVSQASQSVKLGNNYTTGSLSGVSPTPETITIDTNTSPQTAKTVKVGKWNNVNVNYWSDDTMELSGNGFINAINVPNLPFNSNKNDWKLRINPNSHIYLNESNQAFSAKLFPLWKHFKSMDLSGLDTKNVTNMHGMFQSDSSLQYLNLAHWNTENVSDMSNMFQSDPSLSTLDLSSFNTNNVTNMSDMFAGNNMANLNLSNFNTKNVSDMNNMGIINVSDITLGNKTNLNKYFKTLGDMVPCYMNYSDDNLTSKVLSGTQSAGDYVTALALGVNLLPDSNLMDSVHTNKKVLVPVKYDNNQIAYSPQSDYSGMSSLRNAGIDLSGYSLNPFQNGGITISGNTGTVEIDISPNSFININSLHFINNKNKYVSTYNNIPLHIPANKYAINDTLNKLNLPTGYQLDQTNNQNYTVQTSNGKNYLNVQLIPTYKNEDIHLIDQNGTSLGDYTSVKVPANNHVFNEYHNDVVNEIKHIVPYSLTGNDTQNCTLQPGNYLNVSVMVPDSAIAIPNHSSSAMILPSTASSASISSAKSSSTTSSVSNHTSASSTSSANSNASHNSSTSSVIPTSNSKAINSNAKSNSSHKNTSAANAIKTGIYDGLTYKYNPISKTVEFTGGQLTWNGNGKNSFIGTNDNAPSDINNAKDIIFDSLAKINNYSWFYDSSNRITNLSNMFASDHNVQSIILHGFNTNYVKDMSNMFKNDTSLNTLTLSNHFNTGAVSNMRNMFLNDNALQKLNIQSYYTYFNNTIELKPLYKISLDNKYTDVAPHNFARGQSVIIKNQTIGENNIGVYVPYKKVYTRVYDGLTYQYNPATNSVEFLNGTLTWNGNSDNNAFIGAGSKAPHKIRLAQSIKFDKGINMGHVTDMHNMFNDNHSIHSVDLSNLDTGRVANMNGMFQNDPYLQSLNVNGWDTSKVNNMGWMFYNDKDLTNLNLSSFDTHNVTNMDNMFNIGRNAVDHHHLHLDISNFDTRNVKSMNDLFSSNDYFPSKITIGANTKFLNNAIQFSKWINYDSDFDWEFDYPNMSSDILTIGFNELLYDQNGNNQTNNLKNNTLSAGTYYLVEPSPISLIVKHGNNQYSTFNTKGIFTSSDPSYNTNVIKSQIKKVLNKSNVLNKDYIVNPSFNYTMKPVSLDYCSNNITLPVKENYSKDIKDANNIVKDDVNKISAGAHSHHLNQFNNELFNELNDDYSKMQHMLSEPIAWPIADNTNKIENDANNITNELSKDISISNGSSASKSTSNSTASNTSSINLSSITSTIRADYEREFSDGIRDFNDLNQDIQVYDDVCADYNNMTVNASFIPSDLNSLSTRNTSLINDEHNVEQDYTNNSNTISSLMTQLKSSPTSTTSNIMGSKSKLLLGVTMSTSSNSNNNATNGFNSNIAKLSLLATNTSEIAGKASNTYVTSYASKLQSMNTVAQKDNTSYSNDMVVEQSYNVQARSADNIASYLNNEIKSANPNSFEVLGNKANQAEILMHSYAVDGNNQNSSAMSLASSVAINLSQANSIYSNVTSLEPNIKPLSELNSNSSSSDSKSTVVIPTINPSFEDSVNDEANSIANATNSIASTDTTSNASLTNSYANDDQSLSLTMKSLASIYTGNEITQSLASVATISNSNEGNKYASQVKSAEAKSNNSLAGSLQGNATNYELMAVNNRVKARSASINMKSLASKVDSDMSLANTNYQNAKTLLVSASNSINSQSTSTSASESASISLSISASIYNSASTSSSLSISTANNLSESASLSQSTSVSKSTSISASASQSTVASLSASISMANNSKSASINTTSTSQFANHSVANILSNDASILSSYEYGASKYVNILLNLSEESTQDGTKNDIHNYASQITSSLSKESNEIISLDNQLNDSNSANNTSNISTINNDISQANVVNSEASSVVTKYIGPLEPRPSRNAESSQSNSIPNANNSSINSESANDNLSGSVSNNASLSSSIQNSIFISQYDSSINDRIQSTQSNNTNVISQNNSQISSNSNSLVEQNTSNTITSNEPNTTSNNNSGSEESPTRSTDYNNNYKPDIRNNENNDQKSKTNTNVNNLQRMDTKGIHNNNAQKGIHYGLTSKVNNSVTDNNFDNRLPQTNEKSTTSEEMAGILLSLSITLISLIEYIDKHRDNN